MSRLLGTERTVGGAVNEYYQEPDGTLTIRKTFDVESRLESNKREFNDASTHNGKFLGKDMVKGLSIPREIWWDVAKKLNLDMKNSDDKRKLVAIFANDPDYAKFRVTPSRLV